MAGEQETVTVRNNANMHRYEVESGGRVAILEYRRDGNTINLLHTDVPPELEGRGIAGKLAQHALDEARASDLKVIPTCQYVAGYIARHPEYADLVQAA